MTLADPLALADFYDLFPVADVKLTLAWSQQRSKAGGGDTIYADLAPALWQADVTSIPMPNAQAEGLLALLNSRGGGLRTVLLSNPRQPYPSTDPKGALFGAAAAKVGTITDPTHTAFTGFPSGYVLPLGTYFGVVFDTSRYYLGQFAEARVADGSGVVTTVEVSPPLPAQVATGQTVAVVKPAGKFRITPGTAFITSHDAINGVVQFSAEQSYRP